MGIWNVGEGEPVPIECQLMLTFIFGIAACAYHHS